MATAATAVQQRLRRAIEEEIAEAEKRIQRLIRLANEGGPDTFEPFVYGWTLQVGSDGQAHFHEFGPNVGLHPGGFQEVVREPPWASQVDGSRKEFHLRIELPGVKPADASLRAGKKWVRLEAKAANVHYRLKVPTPVAIEPDPLRQEFADGVLQVTYKTLEAFKARGSKGRIHFGGFG